MWPIFKRRALCLLLCFVLDTTDAGDNLSLLGTNHRKGNRLKKGEGPLRRLCSNNKTFLLERERQPVFEESVIAWTKKRTMEISYGWWHKMSHVLVTENDFFQNIKEILRCFFKHNHFLSLPLCVSQRYSMCPSFVYGTKKSIHKSKTCAYIPAGLFVFLANWIKHINCGHLPGMSLAPSPVCDIDGDVISWLSWRQSMLSWLHDIMIVPDELMNFAKCFSPYF